MNELSTLVAACEQAWKAIQLENPEIPPAVIVVGSGGRKASSVYGHFAKDRWAVDEQLVPEVLIVAEQLNRPAKEIFQTLLHESVHALAHFRGIKECSGRRHNRKFGQLCLEVGLIPPEKPHPLIGYSAAELNEFAEQHYISSILDIEKALTACRKLTLAEQLTKPSTNHKLECDCGLKLTVSNKRFEEGRIVCGECATEFKEQEDGA